MASYIFQQLAQKGKAEGIDDSTRQRDSRTWFRDAAQDVTAVNRNQLMRDKENIVYSINVKSIGKMYTFFYDPKHKETLPYYDLFPLIFVVDLKANGFMGINLHYLPPVLRAKLMDSLYQILNNNKYDATTKLKISYQLLSSATKFRYFKPCLKHYLSDHVQSNFLNIEPKNWDSALMLPTEKFRKASSDKVWRESREMV